MNFFKKSPFFLHALNVEISLFRLLIFTNQFLNYSSVLKNTGIKTVIIGKYRFMISGRDRISFPFYPLSSYDMPKPKSVPDGIRLLYWKDVLELPDTDPSIREDVFDRDAERPALYLFPSDAEEEFKAAVFCSSSVSWTVCPCKDSLTMFSLTCLR